jgi:hypothetical protein
MSSSVSQIEYWREVNKPSASSSSAGTANTAKTGDGTAPGPGAAFLSYDVFLGLTVLGGFLALDHLYLRSPLTFVAKLIINVLFLGVWWLYDASQAVFNRDAVKVFGLGVPGMGPKGIAAGVLAADQPDKKHMAFFLYGIALMFGGIFGLDSFIVGDKQSGFIRLVCLITGLLAPVAIFWWIMNIFKFLFKTKDVTSLYWEYFGAPPPAEYGLTVGEQLAIKFPFLQKIFGPVKAVTKSAQKVVSTAQNVAEGLTQNPSATIASALTAPLVAVGEKAVDIIEGPIQKAVTNTVTKLTPIVTTALEPVLAAVQPLKATANTALSTIDTALATVDDGLKLGRNVVESGTQIASKTLNVVDDTAKAATTALTLAPAAAALSSGVTANAVGKALAASQPQSGGALISSDTGILPYVLIGTIAIIAVSGLIVTYRRSKKNGKPRKDDSPPEPRILRESDKKESTHTT